MDGVTHLSARGEGAERGIAKAQGEFPAIPKDKTANAGTFSYNYADLASILHPVRPVLAKNGLALIQRLETPNGRRP